MKRHPSLAPLSRDHHGALLLSRLLQKGAPVYKGLPENNLDKLVYAKSFYVKELVPHFKKEEAAMQVVKGTTADIDKIISEIFSEHSELSNLFDGLHEDNFTVEQLDILGKKLEAHVRKEERILFPMIQENCSVKVLDEIGQLFITDINKKIKILINS